MNIAKLLSISTFLSVSLAWAALQPVKATLAPVIDGELDDACWQNAPFHSEFYAFNTTRKSPLKTEFAIVCTETDIVFAFRCLDTPTTEDAW